MIKYLALLFNTVALLIYQFFFADGITVTQKIPSNAKVGTEFTVELIIKKGDVDGFAKLQQDLPDGLTAEEGTSNGGSFSFSNQSVKFIWMALPNDKEMKISYKVKVDAKMASGDQKIGGKFAYIVDNVKQQVEIVPSIITITSTSAVANNNPTSSPVNTASIDNNYMSVEGNYYDDKGTSLAGLKVNLVNSKGEIIQSTISDNSGFFAFAKLKIDLNVLVKLDAEDTHIIGKNSSVVYKDSNGNVLKTISLEGNNLTTTTSALSANDTSFNITNSTAEQNGLICTRKTPVNAGATFNVEININKVNLSGFAKYVETLPAGFTATAIETQGAAFSFTDQKVKFVWVSLPSKISYKIFYKVTVQNGMVGGQKIDGSFSYIENNETKKYSLPISMVNTGVAPVVPELQPIATNNNSVVPPTPEPEKAPATNDKVKADEKLSASTIPSPQGNVNYSVQIAALHNAKAPEVIASYYKISEHVKTEMAEGFTKYTVGDHKIYKNAHDAREVIKNKGVSGAWVTAYNKGKRITIQEALMITSQKWYK